MDLFLDTDAVRPLAWQLCAQLREAVTAGRLRPGDRLGEKPRLGAPADVVRDIYQRRYQSPPPITEHWRIERGNQIAIRHRVAPHR